MKTSLAVFSVILVTIIQYSFCTIELVRKRHQAESSLLDDHAVTLTTNTTTTTTTTTTTNETTINNDDTDGASILSVIDSASQEDESILSKSSASDSVKENDSAQCQTGYDCVPYFLCKDNFILKDGIGVIDIRIGDDEGCSGSMELCCAISNLTASTPVINTKPSTPEGCGFRNINGIGVKITGDRDNETQFAEFPWMIAVLKKERNLMGEEENIYQCGGSLINPLVIMTAAHCVSGLPSNLLKIRAGEWDTKSKLEPLPPQDRDVAQVILHEHFHKGSLHNDIALLFLTETLELASNVGPICLPPQDLSFDYRRCIATGWGKDKFGQEGKHQVILKKLDLPIVPHADCENALRTTRLGKYFQLHDSFMCAGGEEDKDTCKGDGGSPLVCPIEGGSNQYYQAGIVAWGIGCGANNIPGVYTNVSKFRNWIDQMIVEKGLTSSEYVPQQ